MDNRYFFLFINGLLFINKLYVIISVKWCIFAKKDSIVDTISAMEFCFIYGKCLIFVLKPLFLVVLRAVFLS